jgi:hypothetical protein
MAKAKRVRTVNCTCKDVRIVKGSKSTYATIQAGSKCTCNTVEGAYGQKARIKEFSADFVNLFGERRVK